MARPTPPAAAEGASPVAVSGPPEGPLEFDIAVVPNARQSEAAGHHDGALRVRLQAQPIEGRANAALIAWLADQLGLPRRCVAIRRGESSRRKRVRVDCPAPALQAWLARVAG